MERSGSLSSTTVSDNHGRGQMRLLRDMRLRNGMQADTSAAVGCALSALCLRPRAGAAGLSLLDLPDLHGAAQPSRVSLCKRRC